LLQRLRDFPETGGGAKVLGKKGRKGDWKGPFSRVFRQGEGKKGGGWL